MKGIVSGSSGVASAGYGLQSDTSLPKDRKETLATFRKQAKNRAEKVRLRDLLFSFVHLLDNDIAEVIEVEEKEEKRKEQKHLNSQQDETTQHSPDSIGTSRPVPVFGQEGATNPVSLTSSEDTKSAPISAPPINLPTTRSSVSETKASEVKHKTMLATPIKQPPQSIQPIQPKTPITPSVQSTSTPPAPQKSLVPLPATPSVQPISPQALPNSPVVSPINSSPPLAPPPPAVTNETEKPEPVVAPQTSAITGYRARILEIKHAINEKVGNPVTLIDSNNNIGREYMNSLLEAMKAVNGNSLGGSDSSMERLELAYTAVLDMLKTRPVTKTETPSSTSIPTPTPIQPKPPITPSIQSTSVTPAKSTLPQSSFPPTQPPTPPVSPSTPLAQPAVPPTAPKQPSTQSIKIQEPPHKVAVVVQVPMKEIHTEEKIDETVVTNVTKEIKKSESPLSVSLDENKTTLKKPQTIEKSEETPVVVTTPSSKLVEQQSTPETSHTQPRDEELYTTEISDGLKQLLSEWDIFKSSGFLGIGPSGDEHPLYAEMKDLPMTSIVAGRFEGGTSEIKQILSDYMKGWHYEQNVSYSHGERFENYLRRVVRQILKNYKEKEPDTSETRSN